MDHLLLIALFLYVCSIFILFLWLYDELSYIHYHWGIRNWMTWQFKAFSNFIHRIFKP